MVNNKKSSVVVYLSKAFQGAKALRNFHSPTVVEKLKRNFFYFNIQGKTHNLIYSI